MLSEYINCPRAHASARRHPLVDRSWKAIRGCHDSRPAITARAAAAAFLITPGHALGASGDDDDRKKDQRWRECGLTLVGLTANQTLVNLKECEPRYPRRVRAISGLTGRDTMLVGIDFRVQDKMLYGVSEGGGIHVINADSGIVTKSRQLTVELQGTSFGVDFNPAADALRIVSNTGQNLRHPFADPVAATVMDGALNDTAGTTAAGVAGAVYINNDLSVDTGTLLFDIDAALNQLSLQVPPNSGGLVRIGALTVDADSPIGFDIYSEVKGGATRRNTGCATLSVSGLTGLYKINLLTDEADRIDTIRESVVDLAIPLDQ